MGQWQAVMRASSWATVSFLVAGLVLLSCFPNVHAASIIAPDSPVPTANCNPCAATLSWMHTVGSNPNRILIVGISGTTNEGVVPVTGVTFGSTSLTLLGSLTFNANRASVEQWYLLNPPSGLDLVTVTFASAPGSVVAASVSFFNVAGLGDSGGAGSETGSVASVTIGSANSGDLVVDTLGVTSIVSISPGAGQTVLWNLAPSGVPTGAGSYQAASSPVTMEWTWSGNSAWGLQAVDLQPLAPPIPEYPYGLPLLAAFMVVAYGVLRNKTRSKKLS